MLDDVYGYGEATIGLFALLGVAGAGAAQFAGRVADAGWARVATLGFFVAVAASWVVLLSAERSLVALVVGIVLLDLAVQGAHISNQSEVYRLRPDARSRLTTAYMCMNFTGGVVGSASSAAIYGAGGWPAVCLAGRRVLARRPRAVVDRSPVAPATDASPAAGDLARPGAGAPRLTGAPA